jgi:hypothetical protein
MFGERLCLLKNIFKNAGKSSLYSLQFAVFLQIGEVYTCGFTPTKKSD